MSNYEKMYSTLFVGMSNLVEDCRPVTAEARALRQSMIELMLHCEELYISDGQI